VIRSCDTFQRRLDSLGIEAVLTAPRSPWQYPYVERLVGIAKQAVSRAGRCNVCQREVNFSGAAPHFHIDVNHGQAPQAPALGRPRLEVVGNGNGPARVSS